MILASPVAHQLKLTFKQGILITDDNLAATQTSEPPAGSDIATHHEPTASTESMQEPSVGTDMVCGGFFRMFFLSYCSPQDPRANAVSLRLLQVSELQALFNDINLSVPKSKRKDGASHRHALGS